MKNVSEKNIISKIHEHILDLFIEILSSKRTQNEFRYKIKYILDYSYYMKIMHHDDEKLKKEISRITRILLEKKLWGRNNVTNN